MLLNFSDTKRTLIHLFLFTNSVLRELVLICKQSIRSCNLLFLHYKLGLGVVCLFVQLIITQEPRNQFASTLIWEPCNAQPTCTFKYPSWANLFRPVPTVPPTIQLLKRQTCTTMEILIAWWFKNYKSSRSTFY